MVIAMASAKPVMRMTMITTNVIVHAVTVRGGMILAVGMIAHLRLLGNAITTGAVHRLLIPTAVQHLPTLDTASMTAMTVGGTMKIGGALVHVRQNECTASALTHTRTSLMGAATLLDNTGDRLAPGASHLLHLDERLLLLLYPRPHRQLSEARVARRQRTRQLLTVLHASLP
jgi:hypothetical protein